MRQKHPSYCDNVNTTLAQFWRDRVKSREQLPHYKTLGLYQKAPNMWFVQNASLLHGANFLLWRFNRQLEMGVL